MKAVNQTGTTLSGLDIQLKKLSQNLKKLNRQMERAGRRTKKSADDAKKSMKEAADAAEETGKKTKKSFDKSKDSIDDAGKSGQRFEQTMWVIGIAVAAVGAGITRFGLAVGRSLGSAVNTAGQFQDQMARVKSVTDFVGASFGDLTGKAEELGAKTEFTAVEVAAGLKQLGQAGFDAGEQVAAIAPLIDLAVATEQRELGLAVDYVSGILRAFGLQAQDTARVTDVLAQTANKTNAEIFDTAEAMKYVAPIARSLGISIEETAAYVGVLADQGIKGSQAGTALRRIMTRLVKPSKETAEAMERLGVTFDQNADGSYNLTQVFERLAESQANVADLTRLFGVYAVSSGAALQSHVPLIHEYTQANDEAAGSLDTMVSITRDTLPKAIKRLQSAVEGIRIALGTPLLNTLQAVIDTMAKWIQAIVVFLKAYPNFTYALGIIVGVLTGVAIAFGAVAAAAGVLLIVVPPIIKGWRELNKSLDKYIARANASTAAIKRETGALREQLAVTETLSKARTFLGIAWGKYGGTVKKAGVATAAVTAATIGAVGAFDQLDGVLGAVVQTSALTIPSLFLMGARFGYIGIAITAVIAGIIILIKYWNELKEVLIKVENAFRRIFGLKPRELSASKKLVDDVSESETKLREIAENYIDSFDDINDAFKAFVDDYEKGAGKISDATKKELQNAFNEVLTRREQIRKAWEEAGLESPRVFPVGEAEKTDEEKFKELTKSLSQSYIDSFDDATYAFRTFVKDYERQFGGISDTTKRTIADAFNEILVGRAKVDKAWDEAEVFDWNAMKQGIAGIKTDFRDYTAEIEKGVADQKNQFKELQAEIKAFESSITDKTTIEQFRKQYNYVFQSIADGFKKAKDEITQGFDRVKEALGETIDGAEDLKKIEDLFESVSKNGQKRIDELASFVENRLASVTERIANIDKQITGITKKAEDAARDALVKGAQAQREILRRGLGKEELEAESAAFVARTAEIANRLAREGQKEGSIEKLNQAKSLYGEIAQESNRIKDRQLALTASQTAYNSIAGIEVVLAEEKKKKLEEQKSLLEEQRQRLVEQRMAIQELVANVKVMTEEMSRTVDKAGEFAKKVEGPHEVKVDVDTKELRPKIQSELQKPFEITVTAKEGNPLQVGGLKEGGSLPGYGGGDRIPALLEAGEFVVRKEAVKKWGVGFFAALNALRGRITTAAKGGLIPRFQSGGLAYDAESVRRRMDDFNRRSAETLENIMKMGRVALAPGDLGYGKQSYHQAAQSQLEATGEKYAKASYGELEAILKPAMERFSSVLEGGIKVEITVHKDGSVTIGGGSVNPFG